MNWAADAFREHESRYRNAVLVDAWGHLAPKQEDHPGYMVFAKGQYRETIVIESVWKNHAGVELSGSPWLLQAENDFAFDKTHMKCRGEGVWRFDGIMRMCKNGRIKFIGKVKKVKT